LSVGGAPERAMWAGTPVMTSPVRARMTRSARASCGVGSRLTMTSVAPASRACPGQKAAGETTDDDPGTTKRSAARARRDAGGHRLAEQDRERLDHAPAGR